MGIWEYQYTDELYHHGIKGQKWGVRRYQNKDGTLTSAGKKRYNKSDISLGEARELSSQKWKAIYDDGDFSNEAISAYRNSLDVLYKADIADAKERYIFRSNVANSIYSSLSKTDKEFLKNKKEISDRAFDDTISETSQMASRAYAKYLKNNNLKSTEDNAYGFYHYKWRHGEPDFDEAQKLYNSKISEFNNKSKSITNRIFKNLHEKFGSKIDGYINRDWLEDELAASYTSKEVFEKEKLSIYKDYESNLQYAKEDYNDYIKGLKDIPYYKREHEKADSFRSLIPDSELEKSIELTKIAKASGKQKDWNRVHSVDDRIVKKYFNADPIDWYFDNGHSWHIMKEKELNKHSN